MTYAGVCRYFGLARKSAVSNLLLFPKENHRVLKTASWASLAVGIAALGVYIGRELRIRYKFNRRNPIDFFARAGSDGAVTDGYGVGI